MSKTKVHTEYYDVLGVSPVADDKEIRKAYRKMVLKYHPDKNKDPSAAEMYKKVQNVYEILSNPEKRKIYDERGERGVKQQEELEKDPMNPFNVFSRMQEQRIKPKMQYQHNITLAEYFRNETVTITYQRDTRCNTCDATGFADKKPHQCKQCDGSGVILRVIQHGMTIQHISTPCPQCGGKKYDTTSHNVNRCVECGGKGTIGMMENVEVPLPDNIIREPVILIPQKGPWYDGKFIDLEVHFRLKMPDNFKMTSNGKLIHVMHINFTETICGFRRIIDHPSGDKLLIIAEKGIIINPDYFYLLEKQGFGNDVMYLSFVIHYPEKIIIPKKNAGMLNFENLESIFGDRYAPNYGSDSGIKIENIFTLSTTEKINNNPETNEKRTKYDDDSSEEDINPNGNACVHF